MPDGTIVKPSLVERCAETCCRSTPSAVSLTSECAAIATQLGCRAMRACAADSIICGWLTLVAVVGLLAHLMLGVACLASPAEFNLQTVDTVFVKHALPKSEIKHRGAPVRFASDCLVSHTSQKAFHYLA
jgi:PHB de-polymerase C-terminus